MGETQKLTDVLWDKFCNYSKEYGGEMCSDYYHGATTMMEWMLMEFPQIENTHVPFREPEGGKDGG